MTDSPVVADRLRDGMGHHVRVPALSEVVGRLSDRGRARTEAMVQADVRQLLLTAPFELDEAQVEAVVLEAPVGDRRRIDVEVGLTVVEVKKDLRAGNVLAEAVVQLAGYVAARISTLQQRYVGVLTDGADWYLYHLDPATGGLREVSRVSVRSSSDTERLIAWLEGVLATGRDIVPTPKEIADRLGAASSAHALERATLAALYEANRTHPSVMLKRELWARLLTTALGTQFDDSDELFVEHTLLVNSAEVIAHAVVGFDLAIINPASLVTGAMFAEAEIHGVVEPDFFDWVIEVPAGDQFIRTLARRLSRFAWSHVDHDVMKVLYESIIDAEQRKKLGEYYTPDWLAHRIVDATVDQPSTQRVLDPACGSGTFVFHSVRRVLAALEADGVEMPEQLRTVTQRVIGIDLHPVAVALARVTYLLAFGPDRLQRDDRPPFAVPVYLGDSLQWSQRVDLLSSDALVIPTKDGQQLFDDELRFPNELVEDSGRFDRFVAELAERASNRAGATIPSITALFRRFAVSDADQPMLTATFQILCRLHDEGRDHIWGYYVRNLARPVWLSNPANRVDVLVGNPPWLAYRFMTGEMQETFKAMSQERNLWHGAALATHQDLSGLFLARSVQLYLQAGGRFALVMPHAALSRRQFKGLRTANYPSPSEPAAVAFDTPWDLHAIRPSLFPMPASVLAGRRVDVGRAAPLPDKSERWDGHLPSANPSWQHAEPHLTVTRADSAAATDTYLSPYRRRFAEGATITPRMLLTVVDAPPSPFGAGAGRRAVRSRRTANEKSPWKRLPDLEGNIETSFVRPVYLGENLLPYRVTQPVLAVVPWDGTRLLDGSDDNIDLYPGLASWWRTAEQTWMTHRTSTRLDLIARADYHHGLRDQFPIATNRIVYTKSGMNLAAARVIDSKAIIDHTLYWAAANTAAEARYVCAVLNSPVTTAAVQPLQARGDFGPRHYDKYVWQLPIPTFDAAVDVHARLAELAESAEEVVADLQMDSTRRFQTVRHSVRARLAGIAIGTEIDDLVTHLLAGTP